VLTAIAVVLRKWLVTQLLAMLVIGGVTTVVLLLLDVKAAFALGFIAGLLEFIPTVGPILSAVPGILMGFVDAPEKAAIVALAYWGIQFLENNLLIPYLMRGEMDLPPALTLIAKTLMTLVFGFLGLMVAVPLTAAVLVPVRLIAHREDARERALQEQAEVEGAKPYPGGADHILTAEAPQ
jgi:predicted PurR-regulated permease PerM